VGPKSITYPAGFAGVRIFAVTGLTHQLGTGVELALASAGGGNPTTLYQPAPFNWSAPQTAMLAPAPALPAGGQFRLTCTYNNQTGSTVTFGPGLNDEMCFSAVYYYPKQTETVIF
jgi:hypothetical protein